MTVTVELFKRQSWVKLIVAVAIGVYLGAIAFLFAFLLWNSIAAHLEDSGVQGAMLAAFAFIAVAWGGFVASWFNYYEHSRALGLCVGAVFYVASALLLTGAPKELALALRLSDISYAMTEPQSIIAPMVAGALGAWIADRLHALRCKDNTGRRLSNDVVQNNRLLSAGSDRDDVETGADQFS